MSTINRPDITSDLPHQRAGRSQPLPVAGDALARLADSRQILQQVLRPDAAPRRWLPQLAGLLGAGWLLRQRIWLPFLDSELPLWRRTAGLLLALWPTTSQRNRARIARLANHPRTLP